MDGILSILNTPLTSVKGSTLTLVDMIVTVGLVLLFYLLARATTRRVQQWLGRRFQISETNLRLLMSAMNLSMLFAGVYTNPVLSAR